MVAFVVGALLAGVALWVWKSGAATNDPRQSPTAEPPRTPAPAPDLTETSTTAAPASPESEPTPATDAGVGSDTPAPSLAETLASAMNAEDPSRRPNADFDKKAAQDALEEAAKNAASCRLAGAPKGTAWVSVIFANSGRVSSARVTNPPYVGTATGTCIAERVGAVRIRSFRGKDVTLTQAVRLR